MIYVVTNICPHYRVRTFELLAEQQPVRFFFFSESRAEKYWEQRNPTGLGAFDGTHLPAVKIGRLRFVPQLYRHLLFDRYDLLVKCINGKLPLLFSYAIARLRGIPFVLWTELWHHPRTVVHRMGYPIVRWIYRHADAVVVGGLHTRAYLERAGVDPGRIFMAWQAVDHKTMAGPVAPADLQRLRGEVHCEGRGVVLFVGRIEKQKGLEYLAAALRGVAKRTPLSLVVVGEGSWKEEFRRQVVDIPGLASHFAGYVAPPGLPAYYRLATLLVLPSITTRDFREPWGLVVNEAMHQGCPVVATTAVGAAMGGLVRDGETGLVVPERDSAALEAALSRILTDPTLQRRFSARSLEVMQEWTQERMVAGFTAAINAALRRGNGAARR
jgi:glycosyltransferase involved in cell wall biosynthesis